MVLVPSVFKTPGRIKSWSELCFTKQILIIRAVLFLTPMLKPNRLTG